MMQNSSLNGFSRKCVDSESEYDDDAKSSSAESTSCSENSFEMSSATSFASTLNKADQQGTLSSGTKFREEVKARLSPPKMLNVESNDFVKRGPTYSQSMDSFLKVIYLQPLFRWRSRGRVL